MTSQCRAGIAYHQDLLLYDFGPHHPLRPERITAGLDLLLTSDLWSPDTQTIVPVESPGADLELVHDAPYIRTVEEFGIGEGLQSTGRLAEFGFSSADNPPFPAMHHAAAEVSGATVEAAKMVMQGSLDHAFSPAGGLHHAQVRRASGFCIYNDPAVAAAVLVRDFGARVFYVDFDCHHGDGVQWIFYSDPNVMTVSFHESGRFLFPGTGDVTERGDGLGQGFSINVPFSPFTQDEQWLEAVESMLPSLVERFDPDIIISNHGCDTHIWDPITHLSLTTRAFTRQAQLIHQLAHACCDGRLVAVGSGGYDWRRVVPRAWAIIWAELIGAALPDALPDAWISRWNSEPDHEMPTRFLDDPALASGAPLHDDVMRINRETLDIALKLAHLTDAAPVETSRASPPHR